MGMLAVQFLPSGPQDAALDRLLGNIALYALIGATLIVIPPICCRSSERGRFRLA